MIIKDEAWLCLSRHLQYSYTAGSGWEGADVREFLRICGVAVAVLKGQDGELVLCFESDSAVNTLHDLGQGVEP